MHPGRLVVIGAMVIGAQAAGGQPAARACRATPLRQVKIKLDGDKQVFVEPQAVAASGDRVLVAGNPTYTFAWDAAHAMSFSRDSIFGIILLPDGRATSIPSPQPPGRVHSVRAVAHSEGQWAVVFAEAAPPPKFAAPVKVEAYWFGITDGARWLSLEKLPLVEGDYMTERASSIVKTERGYAFSVVVRAPVGDRAAVYSQRDGRWSVALVGDGANYTSLATDGRALMLAVVYADTMARGRTFAWRDANSLWLHRTADDGLTWGPAAWLVRGLGQAVHHPQLMWSGRRLEVGWMSETPTDGYQIRIAALATGDTLSSVTQLAGGTQQITSSFTSHGRPLWLSVDMVEGRASIAWLHVWTMTGGAATEVVGIPTPFDGVAGYTVLGSSVIVVGPMRGANALEAPVSLDIQQFPLNCD